MLRLVSIAIVFNLLSCKGLEKKSTKEIVGIKFCSDPNSEKCIKMVGYTASEAKKSCAQFDSIWILSDSCDESPDIAFMCKVDNKQIYFIDFTSKHNHSRLCQQFHAIEAN